MPKHNLKFIEKIEVAEGTSAFRFEKPEGFTFKAGQTLDWTLVNPKQSDAEGNSRTFSIASSPEEDYLMFATRMRPTAFKQSLRELKPGDIIEAEGPFGSFTLHNDSAKPAVFLAGGIGITPFRSMIKDAQARKLDHKLYLFFSNHRPEDSPFLKELLALETEFPNFKLIPTMTDMSRSQESWQGETGYISKEMIGKYLPEMNNAIYYLAGPPTMVGSLNEMLNKAEVDTDNIKFEEFAGY